MKASLMIAMAAVLMVAACAGVVLADDEADAESVEVTPVANTVIYAVGEAQLPVKAGEDGTITLYNPEDVADFYTPSTDEVFKYWKDNSSSVIYQFGATISVPSEGLVLVPGVEKITTATFVSGESTLTISPSNLAVNEAKLIEMQTAGEGFKFLGWTSSNDSSSETPVYYIYDATNDKFITNDESKAEYTVQVGYTMTAQFQKLYNITWVVEGAEYKGDVENSNMPSTPSIPNHTFLGWADASGKIVIKPSASVDDIDAIIMSLSADTTFTAKFEANLIPVTFVAGDKTVGTVEVRYGSTVNPIELPEGYSAWDFDFTTPITEAITISAVEAEVIPDDGYDVSFVKMIDGETIAINTITITELNPNVTVPSGEAIAVDGKEFIGWFVGTQQVDPATYEITDDVTFVAMYRDAPAPVEPETPWYETNTGIIAIFLVIMAILFLGYCYRTNTFGVKDMLSFKIVRDKKE